MRKPVSHLLLTLSAAGLLLLAGPGNASAAGQGTDCDGADQRIKTSNIAASERTLLCLVNVHRASKGTAVLTMDPSLSEAARGHSEHMERTGRFQHEGIGDGTQDERAEAAGFDCGVFDRCVGENIIHSTGSVVTPGVLFEGWLNSPEHDANMLDPRYLTAGMGLAQGPNLGTTGTQDFAIVDNGATDTAADLLTTPDCESSRTALATAKSKVRAAKRALAEARGRRQKAKAKAKLRKAKRRARARVAAAERACDLAY